MFTGETHSCFAVNASHAWPLACLLRFIRVSAISGLLRVQTHKSCWYSSDTFLLSFSLGIYLFIYLSICMPYSFTEFLVTPEVEERYLRRFRGATL